MIAPAASEAKGTLIRFSGVTKHYGPFTAVDHLSLDIQEGTFVALMGPSGCGKTTTLRMLAGLETPTSGTIEFAGEPITDLKPWQRNMPLVWQSLALFPFLDVLGNVTFGLKMAGVAAGDREMRAMAWLKRLGIDQLAKHPVSKISADRRSASRWPALVMEPKVLLLDEPLSALDAHLVVRMQAELTKLQRELGITFLYVTHSQSEAFAMADRVVIMNQGRIQQNGTPREVFRAPANRFVAEFVGTNNILPGSVRGMEGQTAMIETSVGVLPALVPAAGIGVGQKVDLVISADMVQLTTGPVEGFPAVPVELISEQFVGSLVTLFLDMGNDRTLRVQTRQQVLEELLTGDRSRLYASWQPADALLLPSGT